ncbi:MAG: type 2 isopentenyl-diphosphate Delta-isomerase [Ignavibacteria bacterium]|nr:type 2 isopentenyl-diphosphate Delta-isomerase [Ignavibacteria bacterium]
MHTPSRKQEHVEVVLRSDVHFRNKSNGLDDIELPYNALPEINFDEVDTSIEFLGKPLNQPLMVTGMTGGYADAEQINRTIALACAQSATAFCVGSMRAAIEDPSLEPTYSVVKEFSSHIPIIANIGGVQLVEWHSLGTLLKNIHHLCTMINASALAIHLNPLQEMLQPEGQPRFRGVTDAIAAIVDELEWPIIVKEVGAGISANVARRLSNAGVTMIDVAGAGGTSWAGVEIMRRTDQNDTLSYWDVGIPTAECIKQCKGIVPTLIASGGISSGTHIANAIALGATLCGAAQPILQAAIAAGTNGIEQLIAQWTLDLKRRMFLTGTKTIDDLRGII